MEEKAAMAALSVSLPYTKETNDYGSAMGSLVNKGLAMLDGDGIYLTPEGQAIYDQFFGHEIAEMILTWQFLCHGKNSESVKI